MPENFRCDRRYLSFVFSDVIVEQNLKCKYFRGPTDQPAGQIWSSGQGFDIPELP